MWAEEARLLEWHVTPSWFALADAFPRLKALGFDDLEVLRRFMSHLAAAVALHGSDDVAVARMLRAVDPPLLPRIEPDPGFLRTAARAWMDDVHDYCVIDRWRPDPARTATHLAIRRLRLAHRWLRNDLTAADTLRYRHPTAGAVVVGGARSAPVSYTHLTLPTN